MIEPRNIIDIGNMPRGGPDASWLDRHLQTDRLEYLDRDDVDEAIKRKVVRSLEFTGRLFKADDKLARQALELVDGIAAPKILELGAAHGGLSRKLLELHPTAHVTVTDIDSASVANIAAGDLGHHPRATVRTMDATEIDAADGEYDLAVFALSFHHLPPPQAAKVFGEGTRVASTLLIVDMPRLPATLHLVQAVLSFPLIFVAPVAHDGWISSLRAYSRSAMRALAANTDPRIRVEFTGKSWPRQVVVARLDR